MHEDVYVHRQVEDLQFQLEEQGVISGDQLETATEDSSQKLMELQRELEQEKFSVQEAKERVKDMQTQLGEKEQEVALHFTTIEELVQSDFLACLRE